MNQRCRKDFLIGGGGGGGGGTVCICSTGHIEWAWNRQKIWGGGGGGGGGGGHVPPVPPQFLHLCELFVIQYSRRERHDKHSDSSKLDAV